ncbi:class I adenylate-forming enzyme family protein [Rhodococcus indonesiensis]
MASVLDPVLAHADAAPERIALRTRDGQRSYRRLRDDALRYGALLRSRGVAAGDRVLLLAPSVPEFVVAYLGIQAVGAVVVPVNTMSTAAELRYALEDSRAVLAIAWHAASGSVTEAANSLGVPWLSLEPGAAVEEGPVDPVDRADGDIAAVLYTSGTTGRPKGAQLTVSNLLSAGRISCRLSGSGPEDRVGTGLPLFHIFGQASVMMSAFTAGASLSLLSPFDPAAMLDLVVRDRLTVVCGVPTMWNAMLHAESTYGPADFEGLRLAVSGGASLPGEVARDFEHRFGCTIREGYGLTETTAMATFSWGDVPARIGYSGTAAPDIEVEVYGPDGAACGPGEVGEVFVRGPVVMAGYWQRPADTAAVLDDEGWFRTGDLGEFDEQGRLRIVDRVKDLVIRGGYNVYPSEVEEVLYEHPDVVEAAVVGVPDRHYGEEIAAVVVLRDGAGADAEDVVRWCRERLSAYKAPRIVRFVDALPKGASGKILKRAIDRDELSRFVVRRSEPAV